jgi:hypothetical protein
VVDYGKKLSCLCNPPSREVVLVDVPPVNLLIVDGSGNLNTSLEFQEAIEVLFSLSYALKFKIKKIHSIGYIVMNPEGLWWTVMVMQPDSMAMALFTETSLESAEKEYRGPGQGALPIVLRRSVGANHACRALRYGGVDPYQALHFVADNG